MAKTQTQRFRAVGEVLTAASTVGAIIADGTGILPDLRWNRPEDRQQDVHSVADRLGSQVSRPRSDQRLDFGSCDVDHSAVAQGRVQMAGDDALIAQSRRRLSVQPGSRQPTCRNLAERSEGQWLRVCLGYYCLAPLAFQVCQVALGLLVGREPPARAGAVGHALADHVAVAV